MILVTGSSGVLGRALVDALERQGHAVATITSSDVDLRNQDATITAIKKIKPVKIFHLAAKVHGLGGNMSMPAEMFADNARINMNVIDAALAAGCQKFVGVSTVAIYSSSAAMPVSEGSIWVGPPHDSERAYGQAKRGMLAYLEACNAQYGMPFAYPIMTNIYGPHDRFDPVNGHVVPSLIAKFHEAAVSGGHVEVWGTGRAERDFIFADDAAQALLRVVDDADGPVNVATGSTVPIRTVVEVLSKHSGVTDVRWDATKPDGQLERSYDVRRLNDLGFKASVDIASGLCQTYDWYAENFASVRR